MSRRVKLCGLQRPEDVVAALHAGADDLGFIFFPPSRRHVAMGDAPLLRALVPPQRRAIAVVVDASDHELEDLLRDFQPDALQLHGEESPERTAEIRRRSGRPVIKAIAVHDATDIRRADAYASAADELLFDTKAADGTSGGTGQSFDWHLVHGFASTLPWYLSGGLGPDNVAEALRISGAMRVDASSRLEAAPGEKDPALLAAFVAAAKNAL
jgi:phosphoribosylanthranilate isomerase